MTTEGELESDRMKARARKRKEKKREGAIKSVSDTADNWTAGGKWRRLRLRRRDGGGGRASEAWKQEQDEQYVPSVAEWEEWKRVREGGWGGQEDGEVLGRRWGRGGGKEAASVWDELHFWARKRNELNDDSSSAFFSSLDSDVTTNRFLPHNCHEIEKE